MMKILKISPTGHPHIALDDARNTAAVVLRMLEDNFFFTTDLTKPVILSEEPQQKSKS